ncbi:thymidine kinase, cytosolic-like [Mya arenaria]|uniref:thymidine kinase, cytosolic-like n=1 Tax=Mya arenaria TaxID=6604 RepID=UPI0022E57AAB|nr:thymidine kinase, cytosolic-like [Mya arenaria]XP_052789616.1 thymidine kinase, cytosolic-like [Mya arenaria]
MMSSSPAISSPIISHAKKMGNIQVIFGPMFSGKTTELMRRMKRYQIANYSCLVVKYAKDIRYDKENIATHDRQTLPAVAATKLADLEEEALQYEIIGIDEGQFFPDVVSFCDEMADKGKVVIVAALDGTFQRKGFGNILNLVPLAENVIKLSAVCMTCNSDGYFTKRMTTDQSVEVIGGADMYRAVCRDCFKSPTKKSPRKSPMVSPYKLKSPVKSATSLQRGTPTLQEERSLKDLTGSINRQLTFTAPPRI